MTESWRRIAALFDQAIELDPTAREQLLTRAAEQDPEVAREVRELLAKHDAAGPFLERPAWAAHADLLSTMADPGTMTGHRIGPYRILSEVGRGGMGVVYAAHDDRLGRTVALKALPLAYAHDAVARERLSREARAAAALSHPAIATVYALEEFDGDLFIASEFVRGTNLRVELKAGALPRSRLLDTLEQIAEGLDAAHREGIVHRDLKPENVIRAADDRIKIVDFGLARAVSGITGVNPSLTGPGALLGTPGYMSPEQLRGERVDARADVFAFGVIAYELATGTHPIGGSDPAAIIERLLDTGSPLARLIDPPGLDAIVRKCLRADPAARYESGVDLLAALRGIREAITPAPRFRISPERWWWWQFHQLAVAALTMAAVIASWFGRRWIGPYGSPAFLAALVLATVTVTLRVHLWCSSRVHPETLLFQRGRVLRVIVACESLLLAVLLAVGLAVSGAHDALAAWLVVSALLLLLSLVIIEPATTRASLNT